MNAALRIVGDPAQPEEPYEDLTGTDRATAGQRRAKRTGADFMIEALDYVRRVGAAVEADRVQVDEVSVARIVGRNRQRYWLIGHGTFDDGSQAGLRRTDTVKKAIADAYLLSLKIDALPLLVITSHLPHPDRAGARQLSAARALFWDIVAINGDLAGWHRLHGHLHDEQPHRPVDVGWMRSLPSRTNLIGQLTLETTDTDEPHQRDGLRGRDA